MAQNNKRKGIIDDYPFQQNLASTPKKNCSHKEKATRIELFEEALAPYFPFDLLKTLKEYVGITIYLPENFGFSACAAWGTTFWILVHGLQVPSCQYVDVFTLNGELIRTEEYMGMEFTTNNNGYDYAKYNTCSVIQRYSKYVVIETILIPDAQAKYIQDVIEIPTTKTKTKTKKNTLATVSSPFFADYCWRSLFQPSSKYTLRNITKVVFRKIKKQVNKEGRLCRNVRSQDLFPEMNWERERYRHHSVFSSNDKEKNFKTLKHSFVNNNTHFIEEQGLLWFVREKNEENYSFKVKERSSDTCFVHFFSSSDDGKEENCTVIKGQLVEKEKVVSWHYNQVANQLLTVTKENEKGQNSGFLLTFYSVENKEPSTWKKGIQILIEPHNK